MKQLLYILLLLPAIVQGQQNTTKMPMHHEGPQRFDSLYIQPVTAGNSDSLVLTDPLTGRARVMSISRLSSLLSVAPGGETLQSVTGRDSVSDHLVTFNRGINAFNSGAADAPPLFSKITGAGSFSVYNMHSLGITNTANRTSRWNLRGASLPTAPGSQDSVYSLDLQQRSGTVALLKNISDSNSILRDSIAALRSAIGTVSSTSAPYTPTLTNVTNISSSTPVLGLYSRTGNVIHVAITANVTIVASGVNTVLEFSLPVTGQVSGSGVMTAVGSGDFGSALNFSSTVGRIYWVPNGITSTTVYLQYDYTL